METYRIPSSSRPNTSINSNSVALQAPCAMTGRQGSAGQQVGGFWIGPQRNKLTIKSNLPKDRRGWIVRLKMLLRKLLRDEKAEKVLVESDEILKKVREINDSSMACLDGEDRWFLTEQKGGDIGNK